MRKVNPSLVFPFYGVFVLFFFLLCQKIYKPKEQKAVAYFLNGEYYFENKDYAQALKMYEGAKKEEMVDEWLEYRYALALLKNYDFKGISILRELLSSPTKIPLKMILPTMGVGLLKLGKQEKGVKILEQCITSRVSPGYSAFELGIYWKSKKNLNQSEKFFNIAIKTGYRQAESFAHLGDIYFAQKKFKTAEFYYKQSIYHSSIETSPYIKLASLYTYTDEYLKAKNIYAKLLKLSPGDWKVWMGMGKLYEKIGRVDSAVYAYNNVVVLNPNVMEAYERLGSILERYNPKIALKVYQKALQINPNYLPIRKKISRLLTQEK